MEDMLFGTMLQQVSAWCSMVCAKCALSSGHTVQTFHLCTSRLDVLQCLVVPTPMDNMSKNKPSISMSHVAYELKLRSAVRSSMEPIGCAVVYYAPAAHASSARIRCRHCIGTSSLCKWQTDRQLTSNKTKGSNWILLLSSLSLSLSLLFSLLLLLLYKPSSLSS